MNPGVSRLVSWEGFFLVGILAAILGYKLLTGTISLHRLLQSRPPQRQPIFSAGRAQMLLAILSAALYYALQIMHSAGSDRFPPLPRSLLLIVGSSQAIYLGGKSWDMLLKDLIARVQKGDSQDV